MDKAPDLLTIDLSGNAPVVPEPVDTAPPADPQERQAIPLTERKEPLVQRPAAKAPAAEEVIEPGRSLILTEFTPPSMGAGERLIRFAYRAGLFKPFTRSAKPRLLATVESPLPGNRAAGVALRAGHFLIHGVKAPLAQMDFSHSARLTGPFERAIHGFEWLRDLAASAPREQCTATAERILQGWLAENEVIGRGVGWRVGLAGPRLLNWLVHAPLLLSGSDKLKGRTLRHIDATARWLDRNVGKAEDRLAETAGWCAIVAAGLLLPEGKPRRMFGEAGLMRALGELIGEDGGVLSRSPADQMEAIRLLVDLSACYRAVRRDPPQALENVLAALVPPLLTLTHGDGSLGSWQGGGATSAERVRALVAATGVRTRPLRDGRGWGYQRAAARGSVLQFDAAPPPLARHCRHGCASTLAFEFSHGAHRLIVNCGGAGAAGGQIPARIEQGLRATAAHSTMVLDDANSTAVLIRGKLGQGVGETEVDRRVVETKRGNNVIKASRIEASHDGYAQRFGLVHRRILMLRDDGEELRGEDVLVPAGKTGKRGKVGYAIRFHTGPRVTLTLSEDGKGALFALPDGQNWQMRIASGQLAIEESMWADGEGLPHPIQQLVWAGLVSRGGGNFSWLLRKMG